MRYTLTPQVALVPLRILTARAPSGGEITLIKYTESDRELSFYHGRLQEAEDIAFWKAKLAAERPGVEMWAKACALLVAAGWQIGQEQ